MRRVVIVLSAVTVTCFAFACGSGDGAGVVYGGGDDGSTPDSGYNWNTDSGTMPGMDGTMPQPGLDASLDVQFPDGFTAPDTGGMVDSGTLIDSGCTPPGITCTGAVAYTCDTMGNLFSQDCSSLGEICADGYGCVTCVPGSGSCSGSTGTLCKSDGSGYITNDCDPLLGLTCNAGICTGDCANIGSSYIGCDYYAVTMLNPLLDQGTFAFYVSIANTGTSSAKVTITGGALSSTVTQTVTAGSLVDIKLPWVPALSCGAGPCNGGTPTIPTTMLKTGGAYRIRSTEPITVYEFNARDYQIGASYSYTNDASLLLPVNTMTGNYYVASFPSWDILPGSITVVGTQDKTNVTVSPSVSIDSGGGLKTSGGTITLNRGDVIQVTTPTPGSFSYGNDLSGSTVTADAPVEVFGNHACTFVPSNVYACDHIEEVMFPQETLRTDYFAIPPNNTASSVKPKHYVRIVATKDSTTLSYAPSTPSGAPTSLNAGKVGVFEATAPFEVTANADHPIIVATYMEGGDNFASFNSLAGDPAMSMAIAKDQYRDNYAFTAPNNYQANWATVIEPTGETVKIDGTTVTGWTAIGSTGYSYAYYQICSGTCSSKPSNHTATGTKPFGLEVYGYGSYTSYWYPGGLNLKR